MNGIQIAKRFDCSTGGWLLSAKRGRRRFKAIMHYSIAADQHVIQGDINRMYDRPSDCIQAFADFVENPDTVEPGKPFTAAQVCLPIPEGLDPGKLLEAPRCKGRRGAEKAMAWYREHAAPLEDDVIDDLYEEHLDHKMANLGW